MVVDLIDDVFRGRGEVFLLSFERPLLDLALEALGIEAQAEVCKRDEAFPQVGTGLIKLGLVGLVSGLALLGVGEELGLHLELADVG